MDTTIPHQLSDNCLTITFEQEELFDRLVEPCREIFDEAFCGGVYNVILDFGAAESMDSFFLAMLVLLYKEVTSHGGEVKLVSVGPRLGEILERVRFRRLFREYDSVEDANTAFDQPAS